MAPFPTPLLDGISKPRPKRASREEGPCLPSGLLHQWFCIIGNLFIGGPGLQQHGALIWAGHGDLWPRTLKAEQLISPELVLLLSSASPCVPLMEISYGPVRTTSAHVLEGLQRDIFHHSCLPPPPGLSHIQNHRAFHHMLRVGRTRTCSLDKTWKPLC